MFWTVLAHSEPEVNPTLGYVWLGFWGAVGVGFVGWLLFPDGTRSVRVSRGLMVLGVVGFVGLPLMFRLLGCY
jgi:hypothetical protein